MVNRSEEMARELMRMWQTGNINGLEDLFDDAATYEDAASGTVYTGYGEIRDHILDLDTWAAKIKVEIRAIHASENCAVVEWSLGGIQDRPIENRIPIATGKRFALKGATVLEISRGRIIHAVDYMDLMYLILQLGGKMEVPGGKILTRS